MPTPMPPMHKTNAIQPRTTSSCSSDPKSNSDFNQPYITTAIEVRFGEGKKEKRKAHIQTHRANLRETLACDQTVVAEPGNCWTRSLRDLHRPSAWTRLRRRLGGNLRPFPESDAAGCGRRGRRSGRELGSGGSCGMSWENRRSESVAAKSDDSFESHRCCCCFHSGLLCAYPAWLTLTERNPNPRERKVEREKERKWNLGRA